MRACVRLADWNAIYQAYLLQAEEVENDKIEKGLSIADIVGRFIKKTEFCFYCYLFGTSCPSLMPCDC